LSNDFKLQQADKDQIKQIPRHLALKYIIKQRMEDGNKRPTGWNTIANDLKKFMGYNYA
jgi:hypothetical protein